MCYVLLSFFVLQTSTADFLEKYNCYLQEFRNNPQSSGWTNNTGAHAYISFTYDAVWAMAFALDKTQKELDESNPGLTLDQFEYFNGTSNITEAITRHLENTSFAGVSVSATQLLTMQTVVCTYNVQ